MCASEYYTSRINGGRGRRQLSFRLIRTCNFIEVFGHNLECSYRLEVSVNNVYVTNQFQPPLAQGGVKSVGECTVNSMEENS
jgi:hypothetical protein